MGRRKAAGPRLNSVALYAALEKTRNGRPLRGFAKEIGASSPATLNRMSKGGAPSADALVRCLLHLGTTDLAEFIDYGGADA